jgi:FtsP/CotA-like multicopper oxidase with cupredoxin domain
VVVTVSAFVFSLAVTQESVMPAPPRLPLPRPVANAPVARVNDNRQPAGTRRGDTLTLALEIVEAALQAEGPDDPVVRILAFAEQGKPPEVPSPLIRAPRGTTVRLTITNRSDSSIVVGGLRPSMKPEADTVRVTAGTSRALTFTLDRVGNFFYWGAFVPGQDSFDDRYWLDSQLTGALIVDAPGQGPRPNERVWLITEWFLQPAGVQEFESVLVFNGKAWPHNERLTLPQNDSVHFRVINAAAIEHPLHLHGFYFRVTRAGEYAADTIVPVSRQVLQNMRMIPIGGSLELSFAPTTPGNWVFHCHFAGHVGDHVSLHGATDAHVMPDSSGAHAADGHGQRGGHTMRGLVIGMHVTPAPGYREPAADERRQIDLLIQKKPNALRGYQTAYGFVVQRDSVVPARDSVQIPGPVLELRRGQPVRILVRNNMDEQSGVHWHGLEIESFPDGVPGFSGIGDRIMPPIDPGGSFAAEFTPPRNGTFPYHSHLHELRQIGSGMYGAIIVTDAPRDTTRDHLIVAGGGGLPMFHKQGPNFLLVNGRVNPRPIVMVAGDTNRVRIVSIHADLALNFRMGDDSATVRWTPLAVDGADLPPALRESTLARIRMGPGETADFTFVPSRPGQLTLEVWIDQGQRIAMPVIIHARKPS